jgi:elongator complex protein 3
MRLRRRTPLASALGVTKVQLGAQSLDDRILKLNKRGHDVECTRRAAALLRAAGFKIVLHWMPNLHGATIGSDREDFSRLWMVRPDEIKIYPNRPLANAELTSTGGAVSSHPTKRSTHRSAGGYQPTIPLLPRQLWIWIFHPPMWSKETADESRQDIHKELRRRERIASAFAAGRCVDA